jgi:hypothetical protein
MSRLLVKMEEILGKLVSQKLYLYLLKDKEDGLEEHD